MKIKYRFTFVLFSIILTIGLLNSNSFFYGHQSISLIDAGLNSTIVSTTSTNPGYGLENALDGSTNDNNYTCFAENAHFILSLGQISNLKRIEIIWYGNPPVNLKYEIYDVDYCGLEYSKISQGFVSPTDKTVIDFPTSIKSTYLKFNLSSNTQIPIKISQVKILVLPSTGFDKEILSDKDGDDAVIFDANDFNNPLCALRVPITQKMSRVANILLNGETNLTEHQKLVKFMNFASALKGGTASSGRPEIIIKEGIGMCGAKTNVLLSLAATQGIKGRVINLHNFPQNHGHTVAELFVDGKWSLYDPNYAIYYTDTPENHNNPNILSFEELKSGHGSNAKVQEVHTGNIQNTLGYLIYEKAKPSGIIGPDKPYIYPLTLDLKDKPSIEKKDFGPCNQGASHIGAAETCNLQEWILSSLVAGQEYYFDIYPASIGGENITQKQFDLSASIISGGVITAGKQMAFETEGIDKQFWRIKFVALADKTTIKIEHPYRGPNFYYIKVNQYSLTQAYKGK